jgi:hypothetical protein
MIIPLFIHTAVLFQGQFWIAGAMNYYWMIACGFAGFYPIVSLSLKNRLPSWPLLFFCIPMLIISTSNEQVGFSLIVLSIVSFIYYIRHYKNIKFVKKDSKKLILLTILIVLIFISFLFQITAPGNRIRYVSELHSWLPTMYTVPVLSRIDYSIRWFLDASINHTGIIFPIIWTSFSILLYKKMTTENKKNWLNFTLISLFLLSTFVSLGRGSSVFSFFLNFHSEWGLHISEIAHLILVPWLIMLILTVLFPIILYKRSTYNKDHTEKYGYLLSLMISLGLANIAAMILSPTFYASGWRIILVPSYLFIIAIVILIRTILNKISIPSIIWLVFYGLAAQYYIFIMFNLYKGFESFQVFI